MLSGPTDLFLPILANLFLITLICMVKGSYTCAGFITGIARLSLNTEA